MCGLFGFFNYSGKEVKNTDSLLAALGHASAVRGTDATGVSYVLDGKMEIEKAPKPSYNFEFSCPDDVVCVMGHTRNSTQGNYKKNYNNHPFKGRAKDRRFTLAHNGVIWNDKTLQKTMNLPKTNIKTDSYVAVQLLEKANELSVDSVKKMAEDLDGMFTITILDDENHLWIIKGDNPICIAHFPELEMYVYASTESILMEACMAWGKTADLIIETLKEKTFKVDIIEPEEGNIWVINPDGSISKSMFNPFSFLSYYSKYGRKHCISAKEEKSTGTKEYEEILCLKAITQGFSKEDVEDLLYYGYSHEELVEALEYDYFDDLLMEMEQLKPYFRDEQDSEYQDSEYYLKLSK